MQQDTESYKTTTDDVIDIPLSKPLSSTKDHQIERIRKTLLLLNKVVLLIWMHIIMTILICFIGVILLYQLQWFISTKKFDSYFDYLSIFIIISGIFMVIYSTKMCIIKLGFKLKGLIDINEKLLKQEV